MVDIQSATAEIRRGKKEERTRMWANAQRDGRRAEYRWRPLFNAAVHNIMKTCGGGIGV